MSDKFTLSVGKSRTAPKWKPQGFTFDEFAQRCASPVRTAETMEQYLVMSRDEQGRIKDVGGFVAAVLNGDKRSKATVLQRTGLTFDLDDVAVAADDVWRLLCEKNPELAMVMYSTHKHTPQKPRLRLFVPFIEGGLATYQYEAVARMFAHDSGIIEMLDHTTYEVERLFYWPSVCADGEYFYRRQDGEAYWPDLKRYADWRDAAQWPMASGETKTPKMRTGMGERAADPLAKQGVVGTFCRAYPDIAAAIDTLLPDVYRRGSGGRYSYIDGHTANGVVLYRNDGGDRVYAYSHHDTDPASMQMCNIFDLVRIHRFGHLDIGKDGKDSQKLPSFQAMAAWAEKDDRYVAQLHAEREARAAAMFEGVDLPDDEPTTPPKPKKSKADISWMKLLETEKNGNVKATDANIKLIFDNDPKLKNLIVVNDFTGEHERKSAPWNKKPGQWTDTDDANLRIHMGCVYGIRNKEMISDHTERQAQLNSYHPVVDYLTALPEWDGTSRVETMITDYLGGEATELTKAMTRTMLVAAVARVMEPGVKFDNVLIIAGPEGIGKSSLLAKLGGEWFTDSVYTTEGKDGMELIQGKWIIEMGELDAVKKSELTATKGFFSRQKDSYRQAYGKRTTTRPRQCVFFGTTNETLFLKGDTGNRRMWVVEVTGRGAVKDVFNIPDEERDQIWAEALRLYRTGHPLFLPRELAEEAKKNQDEHNADVEFSYLNDLCRFLDTDLPTDWADWGLERRRRFYKGEEAVVFSMPRDKASVREFLCECVGMNYHDQRYKYEAAKVRKLMQAMPGWEYVGVSKHTAKLYGTQRSWNRTTPKIDDYDDEM